ncbi:MAG: putative dehydrogenase [Verrucomicrobiales bacterium]|jgi:predicted dehydrogenase
MSDLDKTPFNRRTFMRTAGGAAAAGALVSSVRGEGIPKDKKIKVGFIGCGGRGTGAAAQALTADDNIELWAMGEVFQDRIDKSLETLNKNEKLASAGKINVDASRQFVGLDAYKRVLDSDIDVVILTTTPGFRPLHFRAAIEADKHVFAEKPMAVDAAGVRHVMETVEMSKSKPLAVVAGFCWRYSPSRVACYKQILEEKAIGDITSVYATYYSNHSKPHINPSERAPGMSDIEWQIRNWYNYTWLGGGGLVEQAVHSVDKIGWVMKDENPISCRATGGLQTPQVGGGNIFDHFHVAYEYPGNVWCHLGSRKTPGCYNENADFIRGTEGTLVIGRGPIPYIEDNKGKKIWTYREDREGDENMYQVEHNELFASIRDGNFINDGDRMIHSSMMAIMGRMSAQTGQQITWDEAINADEDFFVDEAGMSWDDSYIQNPVARPGVTKIKGIA